MLVKRADSLELIKLFKSLDDKEKNEEKVYTQIIKKLSWIPCSLAARYRKFDNYQDILQVGYMTLFRAMVSYDYTKSSNIIGYIYPWVKSEVRKSAWHQKEYLQKYQLVGDSKALDTSIVCSPEDEFIRSEDKRMLQNILKKLDNDSIKVITRTFNLDGAGHLSLRQLAKEMNVSHETVRKMRLQAIKRIAGIHSCANRS